MTSKTKNANPTTHDPTLETEHSGWNAENSTPTPDVFSAQQVSRAKLATCVVLLLVFLIDLMSPVGVAAGEPHIVAVLVSLWIPDRRATVITAVVATILTILGALLSPPNIHVPLMTIVANRGLSVFAIWTTAVLGSAARRSAAAARNQGARVEAIVRTAVEAIITTDQSGRIESFNQAAERTFGYKAAEAVGRNVRLLMPAPYRDEHDAYIERYKTTGVARIIGIGREVLAQRKDGSIFPADLSVSEFWLEGQRMFTGVVRDISERKEFQQRLLQSERLAGIGQMAAGVAHESRNALQRIRARTEMLEMDLHDRPASLEDLQAIQRATDDLHELLEEVRAYAGPIRLETQLCEIRNTWRLAWSSLAERRKGREAELDEVVDCDVQCELDPFRLEQVFRNLFENSLAACKDPVRVAIACRDTRMHGAPALCIHVSDNGPGLNVADHDRIFDAFFTTKTKGTGLGLAIVRRIIEAHGGTVRVGTDSPGHGAQFVITLPRTFRGSRR